jgi:hypothetical protein
MSLLTPTETTDFLDATPGSLIEVRGPQFPAPTKGKVVTLLREFGVPAVPAITFRPEGSNQEVVVSGNGQHQIKIIKGTKDLAGAYTPGDAVAASLIPEEVTAVQFQGGATQAIELVKWTAGKCTVVYMEGDRDNPEHLEVIAMNSRTDLSIGDWLVLHEDESFEPMSADAFSKRYIADQSSQLGKVAR